MPWVHRAPVQHGCQRPRIAHDGSFDPPPEVCLDDLWRCDECGKLWRVGLACDQCDLRGDHHHRGLHVVGVAWRPATFWQRICYRK